MLPVSLSIDEPVHLIYRAVEDDSCWNQFLQLVTKQLQLQVDLVISHQTLGFSFWLSSPNCAVVFEDHSQRARGAVDQWRGWPYSVAEVVTSRQLQGGVDESLTRLLGLDELQHCFGALLVRDEFQFAAIRGGRSNAHGPLTAVEIEWIELLIPHLVRALALRGRHANVQVQRTALSAHSEAIHAGLLLVDQKGVIKAANPGALTILDRGQGLKSADGRLQATDQQQQADFEALLLIASNTNSGDPVEAGIVCISREKQLPLVVHIQPARSGRLAQNVPQFTGAIISIIDPCRGSVPDLFHLRDLFGLTPTEAKLCHELASGRSVKDVATSWNVAVATIRTHLAHTLEKTSTRRQAELVSLVLSTTENVSAKQIAKLIHFDDRKSSRSSVV